MTLLESVLALVILGLSAVGYLGVFQASSRSVHVSEEWDHAVAVAESAMESELASLKQGAPRLGTDIPLGFSAQVSAAPWRAGLMDVEVTVTMPDGQALTIHRLTRTK